MKEKKERKVTISRIMTPMVMILFVLVLLFFNNFQSFCHFCNRSSYESVTATLTEKTSDPFTMLLPMVKIQYEYQGTTYEDKKYYILQPWFGLPTEAGSELTVYVNREAPGYTLFKENFFRNIVNWILLLFAGVFISLLYRRIRQGIHNWKKKRQDKRDKKLQKQRMEGEG